MNTKNREYLLSFYYLPNIIRVYSLSMENSKSSNRVINLLSPFRKGSQGHNTFVKRGRELPNIKTHYSYQQTTLTQFLEVGYKNMVINWMALFIENGVSSSHWYLMSLCAPLPSFINISTGLFILSIPVTSLGDTALFRKCRSPIAAVFLSLLVPLEVLLINMLD